MESPRDIELSKKLAYVLRHGACKEGIPMDSRGYVKVSDILSRNEFKHFSVDDVRRVVGVNSKKRFMFEIDDVGFKIKANQGHTIEVPNLELEPITDPSSVPVCIHGTYMKLWPNLRKNGIHRMSRQHIHFAPGEPGKEGVVSGARSDCTLFIYVNLAKAMKAGLKFYRSPNNVILSPGDQTGYIKPEFFEKAVDVKAGQVIYQSE
ncbi:tRNA 2'-phosphotransferase 1-like isoform X2 [Artemia franciscana]|uniref:2'-phosphotransferase n=1 Tax=Artemia franciscana TaxID=6661 RepID=A0AA88HZ48_ARTSF|nr:hypothetical protein QYM36_009871 [Artemia franciscana]KAK2715019.1 hypothetical protein QYM36_009871 [Artemia franciscana]KAK2715020.1 hypothetical protein QYM36_009871 [Artemia franciscana]KAK2715021.1 hypothetical protein QYM36_009871 [Artemia franciscana]KAK2715022.1 hypothetical protein QYM36_009871 [Artemia franciscana]